jgi:hypothetical protein
MHHYLSSNFNSFEIATASAPANHMATIVSCNHSGCTQPAGSSEASVTREFRQKPDKIVLSFRLREAVLEAAETRATRRGASVPNAHDCTGPNPEPAL